MNAASLPAERLTVQKFYSVDQMNNVDIDKMRAPRSRTMHFSRVWKVFAEKTSSLSQDDRLSLYLGPKNSAHVLHWPHLVFHRRNDLKATSTYSPLPSGLFGPQKVSTSEHQFECCLKVIWKVDIFFATCDDIGICYNCHQNKFY